MAHDSVTPCPAVYHDHVVELLNTNPEIKKTADELWGPVYLAAGFMAVAACIIGPYSILVAGSALQCGRWADRYFLDFDTMVQTLMKLREEEKRLFSRQVHGLVGSRDPAALDSLVRVKAGRLALVVLLKRFLQELPSAPTELSMDRGEL